MYKPVKNNVGKSESWIFSILILVAAVFGLGFAGLMVAGGIALADGFSFTGEKSEKQETGVVSPDVTSIEIINKHGTVEIDHRSEPGWSWNLTAWAETQEVADKFRDEINMQVTKSDGGQKWELTLPPEMTGCNGFKSNLTVYVPKSVTAIVDHQHGDTDVRNVHGAVEIKTAHGDVDCRTLPGGITVRHRHGDIKLNEFGSATVDIRHGDTLLVDGGADATIKGGHGDVVVDNLAGALTATRAHGDIEASGVGGNIQISVQHGDASVSVNNVAVQSIKITGSHGDIDLSLPETATPEIQASASHGDVHSVFSSNPDGTPIVVLKTTHDDIHIRKHKLPSAAPAVSPESN